MMKIKIFLIIIFMFDLLQAQDFQNFKLDVLITQLSYSNKDIKTKFEHGKIYYYDSNTNTKLFPNGFDFAYPFFFKSAIVKQNGKYGIIDKNGNYLIKPIYENFELAPYEHECYIVLFNGDVTFDLNRGIKDVPYTICEEPAPPELYPFTDENKKLGVKNEGKIIIEAVYDTIYAVESKFIIASKNEKIGIINLNGEQLANFEYDETHYSEDMLFDYTYPIFGLRKNNTWTYFENGQKLLDSEYKCSSFLTLLEGSIGIFSLNGQENILFKNGETLNKYYDSISQNGLIGTIGNKIFKLKSDGDDELYFQEN